MPEQKELPKGNLTILTTIEYGKSATKTFSMNIDGSISKTNSDKPFLFSYYESNLSDIYDLSALLSELAKKENVLVIRGELLPHIDPNKPVKRRGESNPEPYFRSRETGLPWIMLDFDAIPCPEHIDFMKNPAEAVEHLIEFLPDYFQDVSCHVQLSSSAGQDSGKTIRAHVWFWLSHPVVDAKMRHWCKNINKSGKLLDPSLFSSVQPHYTADPIFKNGAHDPFKGKRSFFLEKNNYSVDFPEVVILNKIYSGCTTGLKSFNTYQEGLGKIGDHPGGEGFHHAILHTILCYVKENGAEGTDREALKASIRETVEKADQSNHPPSYIEKQISDNSLNSMIDWVMKVVASGTKNKLVTGIQPYYPQGNISTVDEAKKRLKELGRSFFDDPRDIGIKAAAGLGKTTEMILQLNAHWHEDKKVEIYVPRHELADEIAEKLKYVPFKKSPLPWQKKGQPSWLIPQVIRGRSYVDKDGISHCTNHSIADLLSQKGLSVFHNLCDSKTLRCEHFKGCRYLDQFKGDYNVRIFPSTYLRLDRTFLDQSFPDFAIIDESFYQQLLMNRKIPTAAIEKSGWPEKLIKVLLDGLDIGSGLLDHVMSEFGDEDAMYDAIDEAKSKIKKPGIGALIGLDPDEQEAMISKVPQPFYLEELLNVLETELGTERPTAHGIEFKDGMVQLHHRRPITRFLDKKMGKRCPVLAIDADLNEHLHQEFFPNAEFYSIDVEKNCRITQVYSTASSNETLFHSSDSEKRQLQVQEFVNRQAAHSSVLVVGPADLTCNSSSDPEKVKKTALIAPSGTYLAHFGDLRGIDQWKDCKVVVVVGRNQPHRDAVEKQARALWFDSIEPLELGRELVQEARGYRTRDGNAVGIGVQVHPDGRVQQLMEQIRESESQQAIDRLRLVHSDTMKRVYLLSNLVLDVTVDRLVSWPDLMAGGSELKQAWDQLDGVLPMVREWLSKRFPELFMTANVAKKNIDKFGEIGNFPNDLPGDEKAKLEVIFFRIIGKPGKSMRCVSVLSLDATKAELQKLFNMDVVIVPDPNHTSA